MSPTAFADKININRSSLTHIFSGRNQPSLDVAKKILTAFPEISTEWLIMGMGDMLQPVPEDVEKPVTVKTVDNMQQTDLFSGTEDDIEVSVEAEEPASVEPVEPESQPDSKSDSEPEPEPAPVVAQEEKEEKKISPKEKVEEESSVEDPVKPEPVTRPTRGRGRSSESNFSTSSPRRDRISNSPSDKKLVKIVFFYEDRSFEEYRPS